MLLSSWYEKCMPRVQDIKDNISEALKEFKTTDGVKTLYILGSYAYNINNPDFRVRDIDVLAKTEFNSGDLLAVDDKVIQDNYANDYLEDQGYAPRAIKFSKKFLDLSKYNIDCWAISCDRKLLHWGPIFINETESRNMGEEAENYASHSSGLSRKKINTSSETQRKNWFNHYAKYVNRYFQGMPSGWYKTEDIKIKNITGKAIKI